MPTSIDTMTSACAWRTMLVAALFACVTASARGAEPVVIDAAGKQPRVAIGADKTVHVLYGVGPSLKIRSSHDGGATYGPAVEIGKVTGLMLGMRRGPQLAAGDGVLVAAGIGATGDILSWYSGDAGKTWAGAITINDKPRVAREGLFSLAAGTRGSAWATWLDLRDTKAQIYASRTSDGGKKWSPNVLVYRSPDGTVCECCQPMVAADAGGDVAFMWRNLIGGARDMYVRSSTDEVKTMAAPMKLGSGTWQLNACPMDGGGISVSDHRIETAWRREGTVFMTSLDEPTKEAQLGAGKNSAVAIAGKAVVRVWQAGDDIQMKRGNQAAASIGKGSYPTIAAVPGGDGAVVVAWEAADGVRALLIE